MTTRINYVNWRTIQDQEDVPVMVKAVNTSTPKKYLQIAFLHGNNGHLGRKLQKR